MSLPQTFECGATYTGTFKYASAGTNGSIAVIPIKCDKTKDAPKIGDFTRTNVGLVDLVTGTDLEKCYYAAEPWTYKYRVDVLTTDEVCEHKAKLAEADRVAKEQVEIERKQKRKAALNDYTISELIEAAAEKAKTKD